jgi:hypothetical protein
MKSKLRKLPLYICIGCGALALLSVLLFSIRGNDGPFIVGLWSVVASLVFGLIAMIQARRARRDQAPRGFEVISSRK